MSMYKEFWGRPNHWGFLNKEIYTDDFSRIDPATTVVSLRRSYKNWKVLGNLENLQEVTAINPSTEQIVMLTNMPKLKRLRLCEARKMKFDGFERMAALEELALLSVSGPKSLAVIARLPKLRSLMIENMRSLEDFSDLAHARSLKCLIICSGVHIESLQRVRSLSFIRLLPKLQHLGLGGIRYFDETPIFEPLLQCEALNSCHINNAFITLSDTAFLLARCPFVTLVHGTPWVVQGKDEQAITVEQLYALKSEVLDFTPWGKGARYLSGSRDRIFPKVVTYEARLQAEIEKFRNDH